MKYLLTHNRHVHLHLDNTIRRAIATVQKEAHAPSLYREERQKY